MFRNFFYKLLFYLAMAWSLEKFQIIVVSNEKLFFHQKEAM